METAPGVLATAAVSAAMLVHATDPTDTTLSMEHADHAARIKELVDERLHEEWSTTYEDAESFFGFLDTLFDAYIAEFRAQFTGTQVQVRKRNRLELSVLEGPPPP